MSDHTAYMRQYRKGHYSHSTNLHGHTVRFTGQKNGCYIDVSYDGAPPIDVINMYDYAEGRSTMSDRAAFMVAVREYVRETSAHDAHAHAEQGR